MAKEALSVIERRISQNPPLYKLAGYNALDKVHKKQMEFHKCAKRNRWVFGGNRTAKPSAERLKQCGLRAGYIRIGK